MTKRQTLICRVYADDRYSPTRRLIAGFIKETCWHHNRMLADLKRRWPNAKEWEVLIKP